MTSDVKCSYGEDAECVRVIEVELKDPEHTGTALSEDITRKTLPD